MRGDRARGTCLGKIDEVCPQSRRGSYIYRIASLTSRCWRDGRFRLSIPTVSVRVSLPLRSRNRIPVEYTTLYSSIPRQPSTPPLLPTRFPRKPHQPPSRRIHLHLSLFPAATPTDLAKRARCQFATCLFTVHTESRVCLLRFFLLAEFSFEMKISYFERLALVGPNCSISILQILLHKSKTYL